MQQALIVLAIVLTLALGGWFYIRDIKSDAFDAGRAHEQAIQAQIIAGIRQKNHEETLRLREEFQGYERMIKRLREQRRTTEQIIVERIEERLVEVENCSIDPALIAMRNEVRAL